MARLIRKAMLAGAAALFIGGSVALGFSLGEGENGDGTCSYLDFAGNPQGDWRPIGCDALENLLEERPDLSYVDEAGEIHSPVLLAQQATPTPAPTATPEGCRNPYEKKLGVDERINRTACWYGLRPDFLGGLWQVESGRQHRNPDGSVKESYAGALGIGQVMPGNAGRSAVDNHVLDIWREADNMELGAQVLGRKCDAAVSIAGANGFETREASDGEPCGAIHYVCVGAWGNAWPAYGSREGALVDEWYSSPEEVMARAYNGVSCGGDLFGTLHQAYLDREYSEEDALAIAAARAPAASYWTLHYVEHVLSEAGISEHPFDDAP